VPTHATKPPRSCARIDLRDEGEIRRWGRYFGCTVQQLIDCVNIVGFEVENVWGYLGNEPVAPKCSQCGEAGERAVVTRSATEAEGERVYHLAYVWRCVGCQNEWLDERPLLYPFESPRDAGIVACSNVSMPSLVGLGYDRAPDAPGDWLFRLRARDER